MKQFGKIFKFEFFGYLKNKIFVGITVFFLSASLQLAGYPTVTLWKVTLSTVSKSSPAVGS